MSTAGGADVTTSRRGVSARMIGAAILAIIAIIFVFQNSASGRIHFLFWNFSMPAWIWLLIVLVVGVVIGSMFPWFRPKKKA